MDFFYNYLTDHCEVFRLEYRAKNIHRQITKYVQRLLQDLRKKCNVLNQIEKNPLQKQ